MLGTNNYIKWLLDDIDQYTSDGRKVKVLNLEHKEEVPVLSDLARHLRNHYCSDNDIDDLRSATGETRAKYLERYKFPNKTVTPGPSIRAGDFGEILVADYAQYILNYNVPRTRYEMKSTRNESTHGTDVLGFKIIDIDAPTNNDELLTVEVKSEFSTSTGTSLQRAFDESKKDYEVRKAESLNAMKQRLKLKNDTTTVKIVERFQDKTSKPYKEVSGAATVVSNDNWTDSIITGADTSSHPNAEILLVAVRGADLMDLTNSLYERACNEA